MCLSVITDPNPKRTGFGWKAVKPGNYTIPRNCKLKPKSWNISGRATVSGKFCYKAGFHIWVSKRGAVVWGKKYLKDYGILFKIVRIEYRNAHLMGKQKNYKVIVADEMRIVKEAK